MRGTIDLSRIGDKKYLATCKPGRIADEALRFIINNGLASGKITANDIASFKDKSYSKQTFGINYALLADDRKYISGKCRYYKQKLVWHDDLFLCNDWRNKHKDILINWIVDWVTKNLQTNTVATTSTIVKRSDIAQSSKGPEQSPLTTMERGEEDAPYTHLVVYHKNVSKAERIKGLRGWLEEEYACIRRFAMSLLGALFESEFLPLPKVILRKECPSRIYLHSDEYIKEKINEKIAQGESIDLKQTYEILRHTMRVGGLFHPQRGDSYIEIFFNQFEASSFAEYQACIRNTLAHEFAHFLEHYYCWFFCNKNLKNVRATRDERVSEALADFFALLYSLHCGGQYDIQVASKRHDGWEKWDGSGWPYAYALYFYKVKGKKRMAFSPNFADYQSAGCINKFIDVFVATPNPKDAYNKLIKL